MEPELTLAMALNSSPGCYAILLGAGVSIAAGMPSAWDVQQELIARLARSVGERPAGSMTWTEFLRGLAAMA